MKYYLQIENKDSFPSIQKWKDPQIHPKIAPHENRNNLKRCFQLRPSTGLCPRVPTEKKTKDSTIRMSSKRTAMALMKGLLRESSFPPLKNNDARQHFAKLNLDKKAKHTTFRTMLSVSRRRRDKRWSALFVRWARRRTHYNDRNLCGSAQRGDMSVM